MPVGALRLIHAANLRLDAALTPPEIVPDDVRAILDEATAIAFSQIITTALEQDADALLITGNTFDAAAGSLSAEVTLRRELGRLEEHGLPVFITPGVLDPASSWKEIPSLPENVTVFLKGNEAGDDLTDRGRTLATILPLSPQTGVDAPELERLRVSGKSSQPRPVTIGLWIPDAAGNHKSIPGFSSLTYLAAGESPLAPHLPLTEGHVQLQTGPQGLDASETGCRGCHLVDIDASGAIQSRLIPVAPVRWETCVIEGRGIADRDNLCERMLARLEQLAGYPAEQVRIITWRVDQSLLELVGLHTDREVQELQDALIELTDQPKKGLRYLHCLEVVGDDTEFPAAVDRDLWHDFLAETERWSPLERDHLQQLWEQHTGSTAPPAGWPTGIDWPAVSPERIRRLALQNGRRWFRQATGGAAR